MLDQKEIAFHNFQPFTKYNLQSQGFFYCLAEVHKCTVGAYSLTGLKTFTNLPLPGQQLCAQPNRLRFHTKQVE